jgi:hypothetical protein
MRPKRMKEAELPEGVQPARCWCGDIAKVKESTDFADWFGMKFFMCANYAEDPPAATSSYRRPPVCFLLELHIYSVCYCSISKELVISLQSPPPLCKWYHWIDTAQSAWAAREIQRRYRAAWASFHEEERREEEKAREKENQEKIREERRLKAEERRLKAEAEEARSKDFREAARERKREKAA